MTPARSLLHLSAAFILAAIPTLSFAAPDTPRERMEAVKAKAKAQHEAAKERSKKMMNDARERANALFAEALRKSWQERKSEAPAEKPDDKPVVVPPAPPQVNPPAPRPVVIEEVVKLPSLLPELDPLFEISLDEITLPPLVMNPDVKPKPVTKPVENPLPAAETVAVDFFGTTLTLPKITGLTSPSGTSEDAIASAWGKMTMSIPTAVPAAFQNARRELDLCDWACLLLARKYAETTGSGSDNKVALLFTWLMSQAGYDVRLGRSGSRLVPLFASEYIIYQHPYFTIGGKRYYPLDKQAGSMAICQQSFSGSRPLSMTVGKRMNLPAAPSSPRTLEARGIDAKVVTDKNLVDFYAEFPASQYGNSEESRWAVLAATPLSESAQATLYPVLKAAIEGQSKAEAVETILRYLQHGLVYKYDEEIWGADRAFFPEETLFYPYADCEDRAALFVRLVKDLTGLPAALVVYPGHVAAAVAFPTAEEGDYLTISGRRFLICDPTYIGVGIGVSMPDLRNQPVKVVEV